jgi:hypothetical protein
MSKQSGKRYRYEIVHGDDADFTSTTKGASVLFFGFHWSFAILEPSGKG